MLISGQTAFSMLFKSLVVTVNHCIQENHPSGFNVAWGGTKHLLHSGRVVPMLHGKAEARNSKTGCDLAGNQHVNTVN